MYIGISKRGECVHILDWTSPAGYVSFCGELLSINEVSINTFGLDDMPGTICSKCQGYKSDPKYWNVIIANCVRQNRMRTPVIASLHPFRNSRRRYFHLPRDRSGKKFLPKDRK